MKGKTSIDKKSYIDYDKPPCPECGGIRLWYGSHTCIRCTPRPRTSPREAERQYASDYYNNVTKPKREEEKAARLALARENVVPVLDEASARHERLMKIKAKPKVKDYPTVLDGVTLAVPRIIHDVPSPPDIVPRDRYRPFDMDEAKLPECILMTRRVMQNVRYENVERIYY